MRSQNGNRNTTQTLNQCHRLTIKVIEHDLHPARDRYLNKRQLASTRGSRWIRHAAHDMDQVSTRHGSRDKKHQTNGRRRSEQRTRHTEHTDRQNIHVVSIRLPAITVYSAQAPAVHLRLAVALQWFAAYWLPQTFDFGWLAHSARNHSNSHAKSHVLAKH